MKGLAVLLATICLAGCESRQLDAHSALLDSIERTIKLPQGAGTLSDYARAYGAASPQIVDGFYFQPGSTDERFCEETKKYGPQNGQIALACAPPAGMRAGERRWFGSSRNMPDTTDGGCSVIVFQFNVRSKTFLRPVRCNGVG